VKKIYVLAGGVVVYRNTQAYQCSDVSDELASDWTALDAEECPVDPRL